MNKITNTFKIVALAVVLSFGISFAYAWTGPWTPPPPAVNSENVVAPINTSAVAQTKAGSLTIGGNLKIGGATLSCGAATAGTIKYEAGYLKYCDGVKLRVLEFVLPPPVLTFGTLLGGTTATIAKGFPITLYLGSNDVSSCNVTSGGTTNIVPMVSSDGSASVYGNLTLSPQTTSTYTAQCSNSAGSDTKSLTVAVKSYVPLGVTGSGNWGEDCVTYITRLGLRGDTAVPPAYFHDGVLEQNVCLYEVKQVDYFNVCIFDCPANTFQIRAAKAFIADWAGTSRPYVYSNNNYTAR